MESTVDFLRQVAIFSLLDDAELDALMQCLRIRDIDEGSLLFKEGDSGSELFIVTSGKVSISVKLKNGQEQDIAEFKEGDFFGEMSIFEDAPRSASCWIREKACLLSLHKEDFFHLVHTHPHICIKLMYKMINITTLRLRNTSEFISDMVEWGEEARRRAITDELTGVYNRRFLDEALAGYVETAKREGKPLSLIMIDLDNFREVNERYGHKAGDRVIVAAVCAFKGCVRDRDVVARYGGDEFTVILPDTPPSEAAAIAEKMRRGVELLEPLVVNGEKVRRVTTSQGLASYPDHCSDLASLKEMADAAMYRAKQEGRNRVVCAGPSG